MNRILELYTVATGVSADWTTVVARQQCTYLERKCLKTRKSAPAISIGTCSVLYGEQTPRPVIICPFRLLERRQVFIDCLHLLTRHEPGNELHIVSEVPIPGGSVDYFLVSTRERRVMDFVGLELQALDTTGTVWPERRRFLQTQGLALEDHTAEANKTFGMNWKMTAKTTLLQLHHKAQTFEYLSKHLVLVIQDCFLEYMRHAFRFEHLNLARLGDAVHFHAYALNAADNGALRLMLSTRFSTDANGIAECLGLQANPHVEFQELVRFLETRIADTTLLMLQ